LREGQQIGAVRIAPLHYSLAADAASRAGRQEQSDAYLAMVFATFDQCRDFAFAAELHRKREALARRAGERGAAEDDLRRVLDVAREQAAPALELRAARLTRHSRAPSAYAAASATAAADPACSQHWMTASSLTRPIGLAM